MDPEVAECPACGNEVRFRTKPRMGQLVTCPSCESELEVVWLDPVELDWPFDEEDDFEDDDDYYDDDDDDFYED
ncbi:MAG: hypothetical protein JW862_09940 [Anaerolineales bacterium]|nr:hypothetical protein [Anaerolineales bacterium]